MNQTAAPILVYADGSCLGNPGPGGWGVVIIEGESKRELSGAAEQTTNNRMELTGAIEGLRATAAGASVILRSDSAYLVNTINRGWRRNANQELWQRLDAEIAHRRVRFEWVKGHADDPLNLLADQLAQQAARSATGGRPQIMPAGTVRVRTKETQDPPDDQAMAARLRALLDEGERLRPCAGCGRLFVTRTDDLIAYCPHVACQLKARAARVTRQ